MNIFKITEVDIKNKKGNLKREAAGKVSSTKHFPIFTDNKEEKIFKPLSKTKPLSTPLFSYSEVYWSYLINKYIDPNTPVYSLAYCKGLSKEQPKYYEKGCLVKNILSEKEDLINILELFRKYPDTSVNIDDYTNYCEVQYDYVPILNSTFFSTRTDLRAQLSEQILTSILRRDDNYHYENISLVIKNGEITRVAPIIDVEFSEMFMYPDIKKLHRDKFSHYDEGLQPIFAYNKDLDYLENYDIFMRRLKEESVYDRTDRYHFSNLGKNIQTIVELHPEVAEGFLKKISAMKEEVARLDISFDDEFLGEFSSFDWEPTRMLYKDGVSEDNPEYQRKKKDVEASRISLDKEGFNSGLKKEVLWSITKLEETIKMYLGLKEGKTPNLVEYKNNTLYGPIERLPEDILEMFVKEIEKNRNSYQIK